MVDFDAAVAAVQDPNADPVFLAKIAYENPEFGANVVANPRAYPGLKRWVAEFGDERARQQLVAMGWPVPQNGVQPQPIAEPTAQPMAEPVAEQVQPEQQYQPAVAEQFQQKQQYQPEQPVNQQYGQDAAYAASNEASTEYVDPYMNPADLSGSGRLFIEPAAERTGTAVCRTAVCRGPGIAGRRGVHRGTGHDHHRSDVDGPYRQRSAGASSVSCAQSVHLSGIACLAWPVERFGHQRGHSSAPAVS